MFSARTRQRLCKVVYNHRDIGETTSHFDLVPNNRISALITLIQEWNESLCLDWIYMVLLDKQIRGLYRDFINCRKIVFTVERRFQKLVRLSKARFPL